MIANPLFFGSGINSLICCRSAFKCSFKLPFCGAPPFRWIVNLFDVSFNNAGNLPGSYKIEIAFPLCSCQLMKRMKQNYESKMKKNRKVIEISVVSYRNASSSFCTMPYFSVTLIGGNLNRWWHVNDGIFQYTLNGLKVCFEIETGGYFIYLLNETCHLICGFVWIITNMTLQLSRFFSIFTFEHHANSGQ